MPSALRSSTRSASCSTRPGIDAALFERLHAHFSNAEIVLLTAAIAKYMAWGRFVQVLDLEQDSCSVVPAA